jgi:hypothetical protein
MVALESRGPLASVADLTGYARALRQTFRRFRRGGFRRAEDIPLAGPASQLPEIARLFGRFCEMTAAYYDEDDLLDTAARVLRSDAGHVQLEIGAVFVVPPARLSAAAAAFLDALAMRGTSYTEVEDGTSAAPVERFIVAPDAASEARCIARAVVLALATGRTVQRVTYVFVTPGVEASPGDCAELARHADEELRHVQPHADDSLPGRRSARLSKRPPASRRESGVGCQYSRRRSAVG